MKISDTAVDTLATSISSKTMYGASAGGLLASIAGWNWPAIIASAVAILGLIVNVVFKLRRDQREAAESRERIAALRERCEP
ncbi:hypothetical protein [Achromobacter xylosoxidans]|uniref:hypothetical protein n=1 Tax=Alcaligenes xylosoxydans xylosoxydans TaxID=85698 RepID=UPI0038FCD4D0